MSETKRTDWSHKIDGCTEACEIRNGVCVSPGGEAPRIVAECPNCGGEVADFTSGLGEKWMECKDCEMRFYPDVRPVRVGKGRP